MYVSFFKFLKYRFKRKKWRCLNISKSTNNSSNESTIERNRKKEEVILRKRATYTDCISKKSR